jgi:hypothetical protein
MAGVDTSLTQNRTKILLYANEFVTGRYGFLLKKSLKRAMGNR